jgi:hypothetical protein
MIVQMVAWCQADRISGRPRCEWLPSIDLAQLRRNGWIEPGALTSGSGVTIEATRDGLHLTRPRQGGDVFLSRLWRRAGMALLPRVPKASADSLPGLKDPMPRVPT